MNGIVDDELAGAVIVLYEVSLFELSLNTLVHRINTCLAITVEDEEGVATMD